MMDAEMKRMDGGGARMGAWREEKDERKGEKGGQGTVE